MAKESAARRIVSAGLKHHPVIGCVQLFPQAESYGLGHGLKARHTQNGAAVFLLASLTIPNEVTLK